MRDLNGSKVLVAGGTGLVGSAVVNALLKNYPEIRIVVPHRGAAGVTVNDPRVAYQIADLTQASACASVADGCASAVFAAARTGGVKVSLETPWAQLTDNIIIDAQLMQACYNAGVKRWVYMSTASAYQAFDDAIAEDEMDWNTDPAEMHLGVGWVKRYGEKACWFWHKKAGIEAFVFRLSNVYGPNASFDPVTSNFIPALIRRAVDKVDPFDVWGSPSVTRDVVYVDDVAAAVIAALRNNKIRFDTFNIGAGEPTTVGAVVQIVLKAAGHLPQNVQFGQSGPASLIRRALDVRKAKRDLGWVPQIEIEDGIRRTVQWWQENKSTWKK